MDIKTDIEKMQGFINQVKSLDPPRWLSRKLLVTVGLVVALLWMVKGNIALILWQITVLAGVWLTCSTVETISANKDKKEMKLALLEVLAKDGLTKDEIDIIEKV